MTLFRFWGRIARNMAHVRLAAQPRTERGRKTSVLREAGQVPAVMYGHGTEPMNIVVDRNAFVKVFQQTGESVVIDLEVAGQAHPVLVTEIQRDPLTDFIVNADFRRIDLTKKIEAQIPLHFIGTSPAVKELGGTLIHSLEEIDVLSLPDALVNVINVDIGALATFDDVIRVKDIAVPDGITVNTDPELAIASVQPPRSEEEMAALEGSVDADVSKVEVTTEKKVDEAAAAEAAAPADKK